MTLRVTVQQKEDNKLNAGLHVITLTCQNGVCELDSISLNQCGKSPVTGNSSFPVVAERSSTTDGNLLVTNLGDVLLVEERVSDVGGASTHTSRFGYRQNPTRLTSFSGGFVKHSVLLKRIITVEYVPLSGGYNERALDCVVRLPGVEHK
jgi:hypothetical protein